MADQEEGVPAPNPPPAPAQAAQTAQAPQAPQGQQLVHLNQSYFKPEFSGKPDEDAEVHLLHSNSWMNVHHFVDSVKVQRFCLTLLGEARLWYHSLEPINVDWSQLQNLFDIQRQVTYKNSYSTHGDPLILMKTQRPQTLMSLELGRQQHFQAMENHKFQKYLKIHFPQNYIGYCFPQKT